MKKIIVLFLLAGIIISCANTGGSMTDAERNSERVIPGSNDQVSSGDFSDAAGIEWKLTGVIINGVSTQYSRSTLSENFSESFTLKFDGEMISSRGAPNLYSAPYTLGNNNSISALIGRSTLMAAIFEPEHLKEYDFFRYLQYINTWQLSGGKLELSSLLDDGITVQLLFEK